MIKWTLALVTLCSALTSLGYAEYVPAKIDHEPMGEVKAVIPLTTGDPALQTLKLHNVANLYSTIKKWDGSVKDCKIVLYSKGVMLLKNPTGEIKELIDQVRKDGAQFLVCNLTLTATGTDYHSLYNVEEKDIVPSGSLEVIYLQQRKGFAVGPIN